MKVRVKDLEFSYGSIAALENITVDIHESEVTAVVGPNGSGKSTFLKCINRILKPKKGVVMIDGKNIEDFSQIEIARCIGYVPQTTGQRFPATVFEVVLMGRRPYISWRCGKKDVEKVFEILKILNMENLSMRDFNELSGGQQQKVLIARALAQEPEILLLDEPTANLDIRHQLEVMDLIREIAVREGVTAIVAIHDLNIACKYADQVIMMKDGRIFAVGRPKEVFTEDNIKKVYGVEAKIVELWGRMYVLY